MTGVGLILGTAAYMSPEQTKGRVADKRSDVWSFGCVLYEMLAGRRAFQGDDVSDTLASVLKGQPDWNALPSNVPHAVRGLIEGCLRKDRRERIGDPLHRTLPARSAPGCTRGGGGTFRCAVALAHALLIVTIGVLVSAGSRPSQPGSSSHRRRSCHAVRVRASAGTVADADATRRHDIAGRHTHGVMRPTAVCISAPCRGSNRA